MPTQVKKRRRATLPDTRRAPPATAIILRHLPDCSVIQRLSSDYSPLSVAHFYAFAIPLGKYPIYSHIRMSHRLRAGSSILFGHDWFDLSCSCPLVRASLRILLYSGIPYSNAIYLCVKYFLSYILLQLLPGYLYIDNLGGVDAKSYMGRPRRVVISPRWASLQPTFIIALLVFSQVYNRVISEWSIGLFVSISGF
jgi:hypothetical protein